MSDLPPPAEPAPIPHPPPPNRWTPLGYAGGVSVFVWVVVAIAALYAKHRADHPSAGFLTEAVPWDATPTLVLIFIVGFALTAVVWSWAIAWAVTRPSR